MTFGDIIRAEFNRVRAIEMERIRRENAALRALIAVERVNYRREYKREHMAQTRLEEVLTE